MARLVSGQFESRTWESMNEGLILLVVKALLMMIFLQFLLMTESAVVIVQEILESGMVARWHLMIRVSQAARSQLIAHHRLGVKTIL